MITRFEVTSRAPFVGGAQFGATGAYDRIDGVATGEIDPARPCNAGIALLDKAPRNASGRVEYRTDKVGNIHIRVGKASFTREQLVTNIRAVLDELQRAKPPGAKGRYFLSITLSTTMGPGVHIDPVKARFTEEELAVPA
jgi:hypothetical protein